MKKEQDIIYPVRIDPKTYKGLKKSAEDPGKQSIRSVISYAITLFLKKGNEVK